MRNIGDMAMLQVAVARMAERWPDGRIDVLTDDPDGLRRLAPEATPVSATGRTVWLEDERWRSLGRLGRRLGPAQEGMRGTRPDMWYRLKRIMLRLRGEKTALA